MRYVLCYDTAFADNNRRSLRAVKRPVAQVPGELDERPQRVPRCSGSGGRERGLVRYEYTCPGRGGAGSGQCGADEAVMTGLLRINELRLTMSDNPCTSGASVKHRLGIKLFRLDTSIYYRVLASENISVSRQIYSYQQLSDLLFHFPSFW